MSSWSSLGKGFSDSKLKDFESVIRNEVFFSLCGGDLIFLGFGHDKEFKIIILITSLMAC